MDDDDEGFKLWKAAYSGDTPGIAVCLASGIGPDDQIFEGASAVYIACERGNHGALQLLLDAGADPNIPNKNRFLPMYVAVEKKFLKCIEILIDCGKCDLDATVPGADDNNNGPNGVTSLYRACRDGPIEAVAMLLEAGADPNKSVCDGCTPLMAAAGLNPDAVPLLVRYGADLTKTWKGKTAMDFAISSGHGDKLFVLGSPPAYETTDTGALEVSDSWKDLPVMDWGVIEVSSWVASLGPAFARHGPAFIDNGVDGRSLLLDIDALVLRELGVDSVLHIRRLEREIDALRE